MNILVVGHKGMLGSDMLLAVREAGHRAQGVDFPEIDITRIDSIRACFDAARPDAVINCAAYTAVDACETAADLAFAVNARGAGSLAQCAAERNAVFVHFSTDYVFDGCASRPYLECDPTSPATVYGKSKLEGERLVQANSERSYTLRIAWLYGVSGNNFVKAIRAKAAKNAADGTPVLVVNDQFGTPTATGDVCRQTLALLESGRYGLYHSTSEGECTWYDFAQEIVAAAGIAVPVAPCTTAEVPRPAPRPRYSVLENERLKLAGLNRMPHWKDAFAAFLREEATRTAR